MVFEPGIRCDVPELLDIDEDVPLRLLLANFLASCCIDKSSGSSAAPERYVLCSAVWEGSGVALCILRNVKGDGSLLSPKRNVVFSYSGELRLTSLRVSRVPKYGPGTGRVVRASPICDPAGKDPGSSIEGTGESFDFEEGLERPAENVNIVEVGGLAKAVCGIAMMRFVVEEATEV